MKKQEINIPKGCKATMYQDGDKIVIEYEENPKFKPKRGDFVANTDSNGATLISIFDKFGTGGFSVFATIYADGDCFSFKDDGFAIRWSERLASDAEKQILIDALHAKGKDWDAEKLEIVDYVWKPKYREIYFTPDVYKEELYEEGEYFGDDEDLLVFERGLGYKTKKEAIERAKNMLS